MFLCIGLGCGCPPLKSTEWHKIFLYLFPKIGFPKIDHQGFYDERGENSDMVRGFRKI